MLFRIFDEDDDGCIHAGDLVEVLTNLGEKLTKSEARKLVQMANKKDGGLIDYEGRDRRSLGSILKIHKRKKEVSVKNGQLRLQPPAKVAHVSHLDQNI